MRLLGAKLRRCLHTQANRDSKTLLNNSMASKFIKQQLADLGLETFEDERNFAFIESSQEFAKGGGTKQVKAPLFGTDQNGNLQINYYLFNSADKYTANRWNKNYFRLRFAPENINGAGKYWQPPKSGTHIYITNGVRNAVKSCTNIKTLFITEGEKKAFRGDLHGLNIIGVAGIHQLAATGKNELHADIKHILDVCKVQRICYLLDADCRTLEWDPDQEPNKDIGKRLNSFCTAVTKFAESAQGFVNGNGSIYFGHIKENFLEKAKGLDDLFNMESGHEIDVCQDLEKLNRAARWFDIQNITTKNAWHIKKYFYLPKSRHKPAEFYEQFQTLIGDNEFTFLGGKYRVDIDGQLQWRKHPESRYYIRVGTDYLKIITKVNSKGDTIRDLVPWKIGAINTDYIKGGWKIGAQFLDMIEKYDSFCNVPDHGEHKKEYNTETGKNYNLYYELPQMPGHGNDNEATKWPNIKEYLRHLFANEYQQHFNVALDYLALLYNKPTQRLPILVLASREQSTGKTTMFDLLRLMVGRNATIVGNAELNSNFNADYASKLVMFVDEGFIEKRSIKEKLKAMATAKTLKIERKGIDRQEIESFLKIVIATNNERDFIQMESHDVRFWVCKVPPIKKENPRLVEQMAEEIPHFLAYLKQRYGENGNGLEHPQKSRLWFAPEVIKTAALENIISSSASWLWKELEQLILDLFDIMPEKEDELKLDNTTICGLLRQRNKALRFTPSDVRNEIKDRLNIKPDAKAARFKYPSDSMFTANWEWIEKTGKPYTFKKSMFEI